MSSEWIWLWRNIRRCEIPERRILWECRTWMDLCRNTMFCDRERVWPKDTFDEHKFYSFDHQFRRKTPFHDDRFHSQEDGSTCISSKERKRSSLPSFSFRLSHSMSFQSFGILTIFQTEFTDVENWTKVEFLEERMLWLMFVECFVSLLDMERNTKAWWNIFPNELIRCFSFWSMNELHCDDCFHFLVSSSEESLLSVLEDIQSTRQDSHFEKVNYLMSRHRQTERRSSCFLREFHCSSSSSSSYSNERHYCSSTSLDTPDSTTMSMMKMKTVGLILSDSVDQFWPIRPIVDWNWHNECRILFLRDFL